MRWLSILVFSAAALLATANAARSADDAHPAAAADHGHGSHLGEDVSDATRDAAQWRGDLAVFTLIVFGVLFLALYKSAWPKISTALEEREAGIRRAIADAEKARVDAAEMLAQHQAKLDAVRDEVKAILDEARRDAERTKVDVIAAANTEATATKNRAIADIEMAKGQALNELFDKMANQVAAATSQVVGRSVTSDDQNRFIREALAQVGNN